MDASRTESEKARFKRLQESFAEQYKRVFFDSQCPRTIIVLPSLSLDQNVLSRITGVHHYEERMLCLLMLLQFPQARLIYMTSQPIDESIVDYYLHLLPGIPYRHAEKRLFMLSCHDASDRPLTEKILERPRVVSRMKELIDDPATAHMICFNVSEMERSLAVQLGVPIYGCDPDLLPLGSKSGGRELFGESGVTMPEGFENLSNGEDVAAALSKLKAQNPKMRKAVVKLNEGFSGEGNALFRFDDALEKDASPERIAERLPELEFEARNMNWEVFSGKIEEMGGVVEAFIEGEEKQSPSCQFRVDPLGRIELISTHDQVLGGDGGQIFEGCSFPANPVYNADLQAEGVKVAQKLRDKGVLGRFAVDFVSVRTKDGWKHYAIEINLRKGGTTHPFIMLQFLTEGQYDAEQGRFLTMDGRPRYYYATDNLEAPHYRGLTPEDLIDFAVRHNIHFHGATQIGVVFHLIGALSEYGKLGAICIAETAEAAESMYDDLVRHLDEECDAPAL